jgi:hypothetical protein
MRPATVDPTGGTTVAAPSRYVVPTINGDPAAAYRLAAAYREIADAVASSQHLVAHIMGNLSTAWRGAGHRGIDAPVEAFLHNAGLLARTLNEVAAELDAYGRQLSKAQHHHGFSLHKLLKVGAVVAVSATALVVTVGAAGVVEAAAATAAVSGATEAAGAAAMADVAAASEVDAALDGLDSLKPLLAFVVPHLVQVEWAAGAMATWDEMTIGRLRWHAIAETGAMAFVASAVAAKGVSMVGESGWAPHVVQGATWAGAATGDDELIGHRFDVLDVAESFVLAGGGTMARDALQEHGLWFPEPDYRRDALVALLRRPGHITDPEIAHELALLRQPVLEIQRGHIDLRLNEGPGHTIDRHTAKTAAELLARVRTSRRIPIASTYWDEATAREAIQRTLSAHEGPIKRWVAAGCPKTLRLRLTSPYDVGFAVDRSGKVTFVRQATVVLRRDSAGVVLVTSYPLGHQ